MLNSRIPLLLEQQIFNANNNESENIATINTLNQMNCPIDVSVYFRKNEGRIHPGRNCERNEVLSSFALPSLIKTSKSSLENILPMETPKSVQKRISSVMCEGNKSYYTKIHHAHNHTDPKLRKSKGTSSVPQIVTFAPKDDGLAVKTIKIPNKRNYLKEEEEFSENDSPLTPVVSESPPLDILLAQKSFSQAKGNTFASQWGLLSKHHVALDVKRKHGIQDNQDSELFRNYLGKTGVQLPPLCDHKKHLTGGHEYIDYDSTFAKKKKNKRYKI